MKRELLYGEGADGKKIKERYSSLADVFSKDKGYAPDRFFSSSGRAEIIGNHTDHNLGRVIVSAISSDIIAAVKKREDGLIEVCSEGFYPIHFNARDSRMRPTEKNRSYALVRGVVEGIKRAGYAVGGFSAYTQSGILRGAGLSSSAAFEILLVEIINSLYCEGKLSPTEKAKIGCFAENEYFCKPCGLLDQTGVAYGGVNEVDFGNLSNIKVKALSAPKGYKIIITNAGGSHASLTEHYADIKKEMSSVAAFFGEEYLRRVNEEKFYSSVSELKKKVSERAVLRAIHFFEENERVESAAKALENGATSDFLKAINESGESSLVCLQNAFVPGSDIQPVALALKLSQKYIKNGAVRLHGGGFAGTVIAFVSEEEEEEYVKRMTDVFGNGNVFSENVRNIGATEVDPQTDL